MAEKKLVFNWQFYLGVALVVTGGLFLADQILDIEIMAFSWPLIIVFLGLLLFVGMMIGGKKRAGLAIPGAFLTILGLLLFIQNTFGLWATWTYAWALLISAAGLGMLIMNCYLKKTGLRRLAGWIIGLGLALFVMFGVLFEVIFNISGAKLESSIFLGAGLVLLGLFIILSRPIFSRKQTTAPEVVREPIVKPFEIPAKEDQVLSTIDNEASPEMEPGFAETLVETRHSDEVFNRLLFKSVGEVTIVQGESCSLQIEGDPTLLEKIKTEVFEGVLSILFSIEEKQKISLEGLAGDQRVRFYLTVKTMEEITLAGAGSISAEKLSGERLTVDHSGAGKLTLKGLQIQALTVALRGLGEIELAGEVHTQAVDLSGVGAYHASGLKSQEANITVSGVGSGQVWVEGELNASLTGAGSIQYKGEPILEKTVTGLGGITPLSGDPS